MESSFVWTTDINPDFLEGLLKKNPRRLILHSTGGDLTVATATVDFVRAREIETVAAGYVASAAVPIFVSGARRYASPSSRFCLHPMRMSEVAGIIPSVKRDLEDLAWYAQWYTEVMEANTKHGVHFWKQFLNEPLDSYFDAKKAFDYGMVDEITWPSELPESPDQSDPQSAADDTAD